MSRFRSKYRAGEWLEVRSREEILATLDERGALDNLPFMPEMLRYCGQRLQVFASAHKTCDTVNKTGGRRLRNTVHLEGLRCDGSAHGGCQANCSIFWKEAWLKPATADKPTLPDSPMKGTGSTRARFDEATLMKRTRRDGDDPQDPTYVCQATRLFEASTPLKRWAPRQYVADILSGNVGVADAFKTLFLALVYNLREIRIGYRLSLWLYDRTHLAVRGCPSPYGNGTIPHGSPTPFERLDLQVGEVVRVKPHQEILATLDTRNRNRGMSFDKEMVRYCGQDLRVTARMEKIVNESTGKMLRMTNPSVLLEGTYCTSHYSERRLLCPRRAVPFWREIWLHRPDGKRVTTTESPVVVIPRAGPERTGG
jgi:hypothetical protein